MSSKNYKSKKSKTKKFKPWYDRKFTARDVARQALSTANAVRKMINVEYKAFDVLDVDTVTTSMHVTNISQIPQGDTAVTRDGYSCRPAGLGVHTELLRSSSAAGVAIRHIIVQSQEDTVPSGLVLLSTPTDMYSFRNLDYSDNFTVLKDQTYTFENADDEIKTVYDYFPEERLKHITFGQADTAGTDFRAGPIWSIFISNQSTYGVTIHCQTRLRFIDN